MWRIGHPGGEFLGRAFLEKVGGRRVILEGFLEGFLAGFGGFQFF